MPSHRPAIVGIGGFQSNIGKTTLVCELLKQFPGWEAIKTTRGHYRSCGKDPHACCVSHLLADQPVVHSGKQETYTQGKDTGRYWDAGAVNVHWVIATDEQIERGITEALERVNRPGVFIEGNSFSDFVEVDAMLMVASVNHWTIKKSAKKALLRSTGIILTAENFEVISPQEVDEFTQWLTAQKILADGAMPAVYPWQDKHRLGSHIRELTDSLAA